MNFVFILVMTYSQNLLASPCENREHRLFNETAKEFLRYKNLQENLLRSKEPTYSQENQTLLAKERLKFAIARSEDKIDCTQLKSSLEHIISQIGGRKL